MDGELAQLLIERRFERTLQLSCAELNMLLGRLPRGSVQQLSTDPCLPRLLLRLAEASRGLGAPQQQSGLREAAALLVRLDPGDEPDVGEPQQAGAAKLPACAAVVGLAGESPGSPQLLQVDAMESAVLHARAAGARALLHAAATVQPGARALQLLLEAPGGLSLPLSVPPTAVRTAQQALCAAAAAAGDEGSTLQLAGQSLDCAGGGDVALAPGPVHTCAIGVCYRPFGGGPPSLGLPPTLLGPAADALALTRSRWLLQPAPNDATGGDAAAGWAMALGAARHAHVPYTGQAAGVALEFAAAAPGATAASGGEGSDAAGLASGSLLETRGAGGTLGPLAAAFAQAVRDGRDMRLLRRVYLVQAAGAYDHALETRAAAQALHPQATVLVRLIDVDSMRSASAAVSPADAQSPMDSP